MDSERGEPFRAIRMNPERDDAPLRDWRAGDQFNGRSGKSGNAWSRCQPAQAVAERQLAARPFAYRCISFWQRRTIVDHRPVRLARRHISRMLDNVALLAVSRCRWSGDGNPPAEECKYPAQTDGRSHRHFVDPRFRNNP